MPTGMQLFDLSGRAALITGGSKGLGASMAPGFDHYVPKTDRDALLKALEQTLIHVRGAA